MWWVRLLDVEKPVSKRKVFVVNVVGAPRTLPPPSAECECPSYDVSLWEVGVDTSGGELSEYLDGAGAVEGAGESSG